MREILVAGLLGAGTAADAFRVAFLAPNMLRRVFAEGAFNQAFAPVLSSWQLERSDAAVRRLIGAVSGVLLGVVACVVAVGMWRSADVAALLARGFEQVPGKFALTVHLTRLMFPYLVLISLASLFCSILNATGRLAAAAFVPVVFNLGMIFAVLASRYVNAVPANLAAVAVVLAGVAQVLFAAVALRRSGLLVLPRWSPSDDGAVQVGRLMIPSLAAALAAHASLIWNTRIAADLGDGAVSWLGYADRLMEFPVALLGVAVSTAILPMLLRSACGGDDVGYAETLKSGLQVSLLLSAPACVVVLLAARPIICTLLMRGAFSSLDASQSALALSAYGVGLVALVVVKVLVVAHVSRGNARVPLIAAFIGLVVVQSSNVVSVPWLGHAGLALSIGLGAWANCLVLLSELMRKRIIRIGPSSALFCLRVLIASVAVYAAGIWMIRFLTIDWDHQSWQRFAGLLFVLVACSCVYVVTLGVVGMRRAHLKWGLSAK